MTIIGISAYYHDAAAVLIINGKIIAAAEEERFSRKKHDSSFPSNAVAWCLQHGNIKMSDVDIISFYDKPLLKFERLLETYYSVAPKGYRSFLQAIPVWVGDKLMAKGNIRKALRAIDDSVKKDLTIIFPEHHLSHAASCFYPSSFQKAAILTIDGVGEWATTSISIGEGNKVTLLREIHFPDSVGLLYSAFTYYIGFKVNSGEYKLMGLAPYGNRNSEQTLHYISLIKETLCKIFDDGSIELNKDYFTYAHKLRMVDDKKMAVLFGIPKREAESPLEQHHCNMALAIQIVTEEIVAKLAAHAREITGCEYLCMAGGVALNCVSNGKLILTNIFKEVYVQPAAGDAGGALGAALAAHYIYNNEERTAVVTYDEMLGSYLGPDYNDEYAATELGAVNAVYKKYANFNELSADTAKKLADGMVVGWFQGRMEFGPRSLGNRSILGDPRNKEMQKKLNLKIKFRESFRPFAPAVLSEDASEYFKINCPSPYMLFVAEIADNHINDLPQNYHDLPMWDKLYYDRSTFPAITHVDFSARIQTVDKTTNPRFHQLISSFKSLTGTPIVVNTSFNVRGEPIVCTPLEAYRCFMLSEMDVLVVGNFLFAKEDQPPHNFVSQATKDD